MTAPVSTPRRPRQPGEPAGRVGFGQLLRAEWTKFRTVRGWVIGMAVAALVIVAIGLLTALGGESSCGNQACPAPPTGPGGEAVVDTFYFVHQPLAGNGSITVRMTALTGLYSSGFIQPGQGLTGMRPGLEPWAKAGIIVKASTRPGSAYAAMMVTGSHGVRMQDDYTRDTAGLSGAVSAAAPRWLRLTRSGDTLTGYDSADGTRWTRVGTVTLRGLPSTVQAGLFATSPGHSQVRTAGIGSAAATGGPTLVTAAFDHVSLQGSGPSGSGPSGSGAGGSGAGGSGPRGSGPRGSGAGGAWAGDAVGGSSGGLPASAEAFRQAGGRFTVSGSGDIAPDVPAVPADPGTAIEFTLAGTFAALVAVIVVGTMFMTAEYRRGLIRVTLAASPRRGRVLVAKAVVVGAVTFVAGLAGAAVTVPVSERILREHGFYILPVTTLTELRVVAGTAALLAVVAVLALAVGTLLRSSAGAVAAVLGAIVLPYFLAVAANVLPVGAADWVLRVTPAAAFAIQQSTPQYPQVSGIYTPFQGYFPLAPWAGFAVLCAWAALAVVLAVVLLRRRDV